MNISRDCIQTSWSTRSSDGCISIVDSEDFAAPFDKSCWICEEWQECDREFFWSCAHSSKEIRRAMVGKQLQFHEFASPPDHHPDRYKRFIMVCTMTIIELFYLV